MRKVKLDEKLAYHEAGHAVADHVLGQGIAWVAIPSDTRMDGTSGRGLDDFVDAKWKRGKHGARVLRLPRLNDRTALGQRRMLGAAVGRLAGRGAQVLHHGRRRRVSSSDARESMRSIESFLLVRFGMHAPGYPVIPPMRSYARQYDRTYYRWSRELERRTERLLKRCWPAVRAVARALLDERRLTGACVRRLIREAMPGLNVRALRAEATRTRLSVNGS
jgi:hypothetical protein